MREPDLRGQHVSLDYAEQDDHTIEKILGQRPNASAPGGLEFKVRWRGSGPSRDTPVPVSLFVPRINTPFMDYIRNHKTKIHVSNWQHSAGQLQPGAPDHRPELSLDAF